MSKNILDNARLRPVLVWGYGEAKEVKMTIKLRNRNLGRVLDLLGILGLDKNLVIHFEMEGREGTVEIGETGFGLTYFYGPCSLVSGELRDQARVTRVEGVTEDDLDELEPIGDDAGLMPAFA